ncbi:hypothetical protein BVX98_00205 [bacterium F11]|nr:hypothetical protein BVX98_00205 [bacterium F11]
MSVNYSLRILEDNQFRFWISLFIFLISALLSYNAPPSHFFSITILFFSYTTLFGVAHILARRNQATHTHQYSLIALDAIVITAAIHFSGGLNSPLYILYIVLLGVCIYHDSLSDFLYASFLSVFLYAGLLFWGEPVSISTFTSIGAQLLLMGILTGVLSVILIRLNRQRKMNEKMISRSRTMAFVADVLSGSLSNSRNWVRKITSMIEKEIRNDGLKCRVVIHKGIQPYLPPSGGKTGIQIPIMVGDVVFGTMIITSEEKKSLNSVDQDFFSSIAHSLGLSLHRARLWDDLQEQLRKVEATMLLKSDSLSGSPLSLLGNEGDYQTLDEMVDLVDMEKGQVNLNLNRHSIDKAIEEVVNDLKGLPSAPDVDIRVMGPIRAIQPFQADWGKLKRVVEHMIREMMTANPNTKELLFRLNQPNDDTLSLSIQDPYRERGSSKKEEISSTSDPLLNEDPKKRNSHLCLLYCKKVIEAHHGRFWIDHQDGETFDLINFSIPLNSRLEKISLSENA